ncbi:MAG: DNA primase DnaG [archaeon]
MGKTYVDTIKYLIHTNFQIHGLVDKHDIIGAIFGQSEGLVGEELDLRELQKNGRIGRIEITQKNTSGKSFGEVLIPSSMDMVETSILAATIESVDKVGPYESSFTTTQIEDTRNLKRKEITDRATALLKQLVSDQIPETQELADEIRSRLRTSEVGIFGPDRLPAGPDISNSDSVILVEGRADVINMLKNGIKNVIAMNGARTSQTIINLCKQKNVTIFVDGDRGGDLNVRQLSQLTELDFVAQAPDGKEVEELTRKEIIMSLRRKVSLTQFLETKKTVMHTITPRPHLTSVNSTPAFNNAQQKPAYNTFPQKPTYTNFPQKPPYNNFQQKPALNSFQQKPPYNSFQQKPAYSSFQQKPSYQGNQGTNKPFQRKPFEKKFPSKTFTPRTRNVSIRPAVRTIEKIVKDESKPTDSERKELEPIVKGIKGSLKAKLFNDKMKELGEVVIRDLLTDLKKRKSVHTIVFDGIITSRLVDLAEEKEIKRIIGVKKAKIKESEKVRIIII